MLSERLFHIFIHPEVRNLIIIAWLRGNYIPLTLDQHYPLT